MRIVFDPVFTISDRPISTLAGIAIPNLTLDLLTKSFTQAAGSFSSTLLSFDYSQFDIKAGLQFVFDAPSFGDIALSYPLDIPVVIQDIVRPGSPFTVAIGNDILAAGGIVTSSSLNGGSVGVELVIDMSGFTANKFSFLNAFGVSLLESDLVFTLADPAPANVPLAGFSFLSNFSVDEEILDGVTFTITPPDGKSETSSPAGASPIGLLADLTLRNDTPLVGVDINPIELLDFIPQLKPFDFLTEDFKTDFSLGGKNYRLELEYILAAPKISAGFNLVRNLIFNPSNIEVQVTFGSEVKTGTLGSILQFTAPDTIPTGGLVGTVEFDLSGAFTFKYFLKPVGTIGIDFLSFGGVLKDDDPSTLDFELGATDALFSPSFSFDILEGINLLNVSDVVVPDDFIASQKFDLAVNVTPPGQDIAFVIDTTGSMFDDIDAVKAAARSVINAVFDPDRGLQDSRVAVVGYKDPETQIFTAFTDQASPADRQAAALAAINRITVGGGGDFPEAVFRGLLVALNGSIGSWRADASTRRILLFGDAPPNDAFLASEVYALAANTSVSIREATTEMVTEGLARTTAVALVTETASAPVAIPVEIFTIVVGNDRSALAAFTEIARLGGGSLFNPTNASQVVDALIAAIEAPPPPVNRAPTDIALAPASIAENSGAGTVIGQLATVDPDADDTVTYALVTPVDDRIVLDGTSIKVAPGAEIDFEDRQSIALSVTATDSAGNSFTKALSILVTNVAETFSGSAGDDNIRGDAGNNDLQGLAGNDILNGRRGNDSMTGGTGSDIFVVSTGSDIVTDFFSQAEATAPVSLLFLKVPVVRPGADQIQLGTFASDFNTAIARATQVGNNTVFDFGGGTQLTLLDTQRTELRPQDFIFG